MFKHARGVDINMQSRLRPPSSIMHPSADVTRARHSVTRARHSVTRRVVSQAVTPTACRCMRPRASSRRATQVHPGPFRPQGWLLLVSYRRLFGIPAPGAAGCGDRPACDPDENHAPVGGFESVVGAKTSIRIMNSESLAAVLVERACPMLRRHDASFCPEYVIHVNSYKDDSFKRAIRQGCPSSQVTGKPKWGSMMPPFVTSSASLTAT